MLENTGGRKYRRRGAREGPPAAGGTRAKLRRQEGCPAQQMECGREVGRRPGRTHLDARQSPELELPSSDCWQGLGV